MQSCLAAGALMVLCALSGSVLAQQAEDKCAADDLKIVARDLKLPELSPRADEGNVIAAACRTWPYRSNLLLAALAYDEGVEYEKKLIVAVIDEKTRRVVSSLRSTIGEDAVTEVGEYSLRLDTARYQLADGVRAFGVRFNSSARGASCGEAYWGDELTLYVPEGSNLRPVVTMNLSQQHWLKGCPAATSSALWEDAALAVGMARASTNGFHDLEVTAKISVSVEGDAAAGELKDRIERHTLHYDGKTYQKGKAVPWWLAI